MRYIVGVSDMKVSNEPGDTIITHALGSCVGIAIHDREAGVGGVLHYMLPLSSMDKRKADENPLMFGDTAIPLFFRRAYELGAAKNNLRVVITGGARIFANADYFDIGRRNVVIARKMFWHNDIMIAAEEVGGIVPRTLYLEVGSGEAWMTSRGRRFEL